MESSLIYLFTSPYSGFIPALRDESSIKKQAENTQPLQYDAAPVVVTTVARYSTQNCLSRLFCRIITASGFLSLAAESQSISGEYREKMAVFGM